ncbi:hypothetical protein [Streptomyces sp. NPDC015242]|uniref:hypothetical protein n=1 Tax=Streptomyces sp. NPDC015242 TaxID=3364951 RepID=UPI0036F58835
MKQSGLLDHVAEFERVWNDPAYTHSALPPLDVNEAIANSYEAPTPFTMTRDMLWDMEVRKARNPAPYLPSVMQPGSVRIWGEQPTGDDETEIFVRASMQHPWIGGSDYGLVLEQVRLDPAAQRVTFIGATQLVDDSGELVKADAFQPLFQVEHAVAGTDSRPLSLWRVANLTDARTTREALSRCFSQLANSPWLYEYIEIYIRKDLRVDLRRRHMHGTSHS